MSVYKRNGKWTCEIRIRDFRKAKHNFATKKEALAWEQDFIAKYNGEVNMSFNDFIQEYLEHIQLHVKRTTYANKVNIINNHIVPYFKNKKLNNIKPIDIVHWQDSLIRKGFKPTYLKTIKNQLNAILNYAVQMYGLDNNPASKAGKFGQKCADEEIKALTIEEFNKIAEETKEDIQLFTAINIGFYAGLRISEILGLQRCSIDLDKGVIRVRHNYCNVGGVCDLTTPKTRQSIRDVPMPSILIDVIRNYFTCFVEIEDDDLIFSTNRTSLSCKYKKCAIRAGFEDVTFHQLRHSYISNLIQSGASPVVVGKLAGQGTLSITLHYSHIFEGEKERTVSRFNEFIKEKESD